MPKQVREWRTSRRSCAHSHSSGRGVPDQEPAATHLSALRRLTQGRQRMLGLPVRQADDARFPPQARPPRSRPLGVVTFDGVGYIHASLQPLGTNYSALQATIAGIQDCQDGGPPCSGSDLPAGTATRPGLPALARQPGGPASPRAPQPSWPSWPRKAPCLAPSPRPGPHEGDGKPFCC